MKKELIYIGYYDTPRSRHTHFAPASGCSKMQYVARTMASCGYPVRICSLARPLSSKPTFFKSEDVKESDGVSVHFFHYWGVNHLLLRKLSTIWQMVCLFFYLLFQVRKRDTIVVYHALSYASLIYALKQIVGFRLIMEVEEIYQDVKQVYGFNSKIENKLLTVADAYIFPTEMLDQKVNGQDKPSIIIYGNYHVSPVLSDHQNDGRTHVVYSGTFDERKGGALSSIRAAEFLDDAYHIHITGKGSEADIERIRQEIARVSQQSSCQVTYDGFIADKDFLPYIQQFNIGLCTQDPDDSLSSSCFPSKILMYMSNGLTVLSSKAPAVVNSQIASELFFYDSQSPADIAASLQTIPLNMDKRQVVQALDERCKDLMTGFLSEMVGS